MNDNMMKNVQNLGQVLTSKDIDTLQQLIHSIAGDKIDAVYEDLDGYEVPPATQFSMLKKPAVTIKDGHMTFNMACIRLFENIQFVLPVVNEKRHRLAVIPCKEEEMSAIDWARKRSDDTWTNRTITNRDLVSKIGVFMQWNKDSRYKVLGEVRLSSRGPILVFDLDEAVMFSKQEVECLDESTGEITVKKKDIKYYPDKYMGRIGMSYSDYAEARQLSFFEDFSNYFGQDGSVFNSEENEQVSEQKQPLFASSDIITKAENVITKSYSESSGNTYGSENNGANMELGEDGKE